MPSNELIIANPESAGRVFEAGEDVRAFLLSGSRRLGIQFSNPFLLWVKPATTTFWIAGARDCGHAPQWEALPESADEYYRFTGLKRLGLVYSVCTCDGRFIE